jgi:shikimate dehydrogenase
LAAVIGHPVRHSLSPALHNAAFAALGLDCAYVAFDVPPDHAADALAAMRSLGLLGLSVTMPHKAAAAAAVDRLSPVAQRLGAVNCVRWEGEELVGENTDGGGFVRSLAEEAGFDAAGRRCVVFGAGGAARAVVLALHDAGAAEVAVVNRTRAAAVAAAALAGTRGRVLDDARDVADADLVVNATPLGMERSGGDLDEMPTDPRLLHRGQVVADLVYHPLRTALLQAAESRGATTVNGVGMLLHQAGLAFEHWTGRVAPIAAMRDALPGALHLGDGNRREHKP